MLLLLTLCIVALIWFYYIYNRNMMNKEIFSNNNNNKKGLKFASKPDYVNSNLESEVKFLQMQKKKNTNVLANINHKNSFGANNWKKFLATEPPKQSKKLIKPKEESDKSSQYDKNKVQTKNSNYRNKMSNSKNNTIKIITDNTTQYNQVSDIKTHSDNKYSNIKGQVLTKQIAIDCEMVGVEVGVNTNMLARVSLVNANGDCIYDKYVKPTEPVLDYRTRFSGIRPTDLENSTDFKIVQREVAEILKNRILVGHAVKNDLKVLFLTHPHRCIRDTSKFKKFREGRTPALKKLAKKYLGVTIQDGEHCSVQDALAAMQLYRMFRKEWEASLRSNKVFKASNKSTQQISKSDPTMDV